MITLNTPNISAASGLACPSLYNSVMMIRIIDGKLCIVKGPNMVACVCLQNFYMPIGVWNESTVIMDPGETRKIELGMVADFGKRREIYDYDLLSYLPGSPQASIALSLSVSCVAKTLNETISFVSGTSFTTTIANLKKAINDNANIKDEIEIINANTTLKTFQIRAVNKGFDFAYTLTIVSSALEIPNEIYQTATRYEYGRCKFILVLPNYNENVIPVLASNDKHIKYAYDDDYQKNGSKATFRNLGKILMLSADDDVEETDMNLNETLWLKNTHSTALQIQILVAS